MTSCTCIRSNLIPSTPERSCPQHGTGDARPRVTRQAQETTTGTPPLPEGQGVPVVDLTATVRGLYDHAEDARRRAVVAEDLAASLRREASYLESIAGVLSGEVSPDAAARG